MLYTDMQYEDDIKRLVWSDIVEAGEAYHITSLEFTRTRGYDVHAHEDFAELFLVERGEGIHLVNGQAVALRSGDLVLVRASDRHGLRTPSAAGFGYINLAFPLESLRFVKERYFLGDRGFWGGEEELPAMCELDEARRDGLLSRMRELARSPRSRLHV
ncbi:MAG: AraC family ligand binding domain-containing protein, partial [Spirochaetaceae bacterium]|nr:AraC family ligand binding domain-containing protein [Spirochaetaceae bacterium]